MSMINLMIFITDEGCVDRHAPKMNKKAIDLKAKPWITKEIFRLKKEKKRQPNNENINKIYKVLVRVIRDLKKSKKQYYKSYFEENEVNIKNTWKGINEIINPNKSTLMNVTQMNLNGKIIDNPLAISNNFIIFNNFFPM